MLDMTQRAVDAGGPPGLRRRAPPALLDAIRRGLERGELPADLDAERLVDRLAGPVFYRHLVVQEPYTGGDVERLVDDVLGGRLPTRRRAGRSGAARRSSA